MLIGHSEQKVATTYFRHINKTFWMADSAEDKSHRNSRICYFGEISRGSII